jgi:hypothetical protein
VRFRLLGRRWEIHLVRRMPADRNGDCDDKKRLARVREGLSEQDELRVALHEILHASDWWKEEAWVDDVSRAMSSVLWRLGWRRRRSDSRGT